MTSFIILHKATADPNQLLPYTIFTPCCTISGEAGLTG